MAQPSIIRQGTTATRSPPPGDPAWVAAMVDALGVAWTTYRLYEDPRSIEAFHQAVATLADAPDFPWLVEVRRNDFVWNRHPIPARRRAVARLAAQAFARGIGALGFTAPPLPNHVLALFEVIGGEPARAGIAPLQALAEGGAGTVLLLEHGTLVEGGQEQPDEGRLVVEHAVYQAGQSSEGQGETGGVEGFLDRYLWEYGHFHEGMDPEEMARHGEMTRACIDSMSSLSREEQATLLARLLNRSDDPAFLALLDQLADDDLARLADDLDAQAHPLLWEYLRIACDQGSRSRQLLRRVLEGSGQAGRLSERVERLLADRNGEAPGGAAARLAAQRPDGARHRQGGVETLRALLTTPDDESFGRLAALWSRKVTNALQEGDLPATRAWLAAVCPGSLTPNRAALVGAEMVKVMRAGLLDALMAEPEAGRSTGLDHAAALAVLAPAALIDQLATQVERDRRRALVDMLATAAATDPDPLLQRLHDGRWYLVRNLVIALGRSRRPEVVPALLPLCSHRDHRVRSETLRSLRSLDSDAASQAALAALADREAAVRAQAATLLRESRDPTIERTLIGRLADGPPAAVGVAIVTALAGRRSTAAHACLRDLARRRLVLSPSQRVIRREARRWLKKGRG
jgi:hypothetical protein